MRILGHDIRLPRILRRGLESSFLGASSRGNTAAGKHIDAEAAMKISAAYGCIRVLSTQMALLPCFVYKRLPGGGKERGTAHPLYTMLHSRPNPWQSNFAFKAMMTAHCAMRGNAYAYKELLGNGRLNLIPMNPDRTTPEWTPDRRAKQFRFRDEQGHEFIFPQDKVFHLQWISSDGLKGRSPIEDLKEPLAVAAAAEEYLARFFSNGARPPGALVLKSALSKEKKDQLKKDWQELYGGTQNAWRTPVLEGDLEYKSLAITNDQSQLAQIIAASTPAICRIWGIPPHMVADLTRSTNNNIEQQGLEFYKHCLMVWKVLWEQELMLSFLSEDELETTTIEHVDKAILMGDIKSRNEALQIQRQNGIINADEWREIENMNPLPNGEGKIYLVNMAMQTPGAASEAQNGGDGGGDNPKPSGGGQDDEDAPEDDPAADDGKSAGSGRAAASPDELRMMFIPLFVEALGRLRRKEAKAAAAARRANTTVQFIDEFYARHRETIRDVLRGPLETLDAVAGRMGVPVSLTGADAFVDRYVRESAAALTSDRAERAIEAWERGEAADGDDVKLLFNMMIG